jgi:hypothetical protein
MEGKLPKFYLRPTLLLYQNQDIDTAKKRGGRRGEGEERNKEKLQTWISHEHRTKILNKNY